MSCTHENMEMVYAPIVGGGGAVMEPIGESCPDCGFSPDGLGIALRGCYEPPEKVDVIEKVKSEIAFLRFRDRADLSLVQ